MDCPNCGAANNDTAKFCKSCGASLTGSAGGQSLSHDHIISHEDGADNSNRNKIIIVALVIVCVVLGAVAIMGMGHDDTTQQAPVVQNDTAKVESEEPATSEVQSTSASPQTSAMSILGGSFSTGSGVSDKTHAKIFVGSEHSGEQVTIQIWYSRDGSTLNNGNMVPKTVDSSGYINVASANAFKYYPDTAEINLYDSSGSKLLDTFTVFLSPESGTQTF